MAALDTRASLGALWSCFQLRKERAGNAEVDGQLDDAIEALRASYARLPRGAVVFAVWSLAPFLREGHLGHEAMSALCRELFGCAPAEIAAWSASRSAGALPPDPSHRILDSSSRTEYSGSVVSTAVEMCVHDDLGRLRPLAHPAAWPSFSMVWESVDCESHQESAASWIGIVHARVTLPRLGAMTLALDADVSVSPSQVRTDFASCDSQHGSAPLGLNGFLRMEKEPGRPGVTRVVGQSTVAWSGTEPAAMVAGVVSWWSQLDAMCLALAGADERR